MRTDYTSRLEKIEAVLKKTLPAMPDNKWFRDVFAMPPQGWVDPLIEPCKDLLQRGGKRWRPLLMMLTCESLGGGDAALPLSPLVEFCHNASLIHDDIEDNSDTRRGLPAVHLIYGTDTAINSGCFLYFLPLICIENWNASCEAKLKLWSLWAVQMRRLHLGQSLDITWHRDASFLPKIDDYYTMCRLKTGVLARFGVETGMLAAEFIKNSNYDDDFCIKLSEAAENLGVGFQILDDVKNLNEGIPGKKRGDDIVEGKKSLPVLIFLYGGNTDKERQDRLNFVGNCFKAAAAGGVQTPEVEELIQELNRSGSLQEAEAKGHELLNAAKNAFSCTGFELLAGFSAMFF